jgi:hypothetical protein
MPRGKSSSLTTNIATAKQWTSNIPDVSKMFDLKSTDELTKIVNDWINGGMQDGDGTYKGGAASSHDDDDTTTTATTSQKTAAVANTAPSGGKKGGNYSSIDDAFEDLMGD